MDNRGLVVSWSSDGGGHWSAPVATGFGHNGIGAGFVVQGLGGGKFAVAYNKPVAQSTTRQYLTTLSYSTLTKQ